MLTRLPICQNEAVSKIHDPVFATFSFPHSVHNLFLCSVLSMLKKKKKREREKGKKMDLPQEGTQEPLLSAPLPSRRSWAFEKLKNVGHFSLGKIPKQEIFKYL